MAVQDAASQMDFDCHHLTMVADLSPPQELHTPAEHHKAPEAASIGEAAAAAAAAPAAILHPHTQALTPALKAPRAHPPDHLAPTVAPAPVTPASTAQPPNASGAGSPLHAACQVDVTSPVYLRPPCFCRSNIRMAGQLLVCSSWSVALAHV